MWTSRAHVSQRHDLRSRAAPLPPLQQTVSPFASSALLVVASDGPLKNLKTKTKAELRTDSIFFAAIGWLFFRKIVFF